MAFKMKPFSGFKKDGFVTRGRKKHARSIRKGVGNITDKGKVETHRMTSDIKGNPTGRYKVWPSITFDKQGNKKQQTAQEAYKAGEMYEFKSKKKAQKFAYGSWKKGKNKKEAMKQYKADKKRGLI